MRTISATKPKLASHYYSSQPMRKLCTSLALLGGLWMSQAAVNAADVVVRRGNQRDGGKITKVSKTEVALTKQVGGEMTIPVNEIDFIEWDGAPASMGLGRSSLAAGQLDAAQKQLEQAQKEAAAADNSGLKGDLEYLLGKVLAEKAMADGSQQAAAIEKLKAYTTGNRDHYRTFDGQLLLGDVAVAAGDYATAVSAFTSVGSAPWQDYKMAAQIGQGRVLLAQNNVDGAKREFDAVAAVAAETAGEKSRRLEGLLGQARCQQAQQQWQPAIDNLKKVIDESTPSDSRLQAEAYILQGDCFTGSGANPKEAILAYLHVDVIPALSKETDLHAEALYHLARLWKQIGQDERARDAADALRNLYAESSWAKKLSG
ncbi:MAG: tetratricopeptide repeat protein [Planctomycetaceae bacterium]